MSLVLVPLQPKDEETFRQRGQEMCANLFRGKGLDKYFVSHSVLEQKRRVLTKINASRRI
jgi:hypothetical protein